MNVSLDNGVYYIEVAIKQSFLEGIEEYSFVLTNRYNEDDIVNLNFMKKNQTDVYYLFEITFPFCTNINRFIDDEMWDLHILRKIEDNTEIKSRITTRDRQLNFHTIVQEDQGKMIYPFATKKGNLSFYANDY